MYLSSFTPFSSFLFIAKSINGCENFEKNAKTKFLHKHKETNFLLKGKMEKKILADVLRRLNQILHHHQHLG